MFAGAVVKGERETFSHFAISVVGVFVGERVDAKHGLGKFVTEFAFQVGEGDALFWAIEKAED